MNGYSTPGAGLHILKQSEMTNSMMIRFSDILHPSCILSLGLCSESTSTSWFYHLGAQHRPTAITHEQRILAKRIDPILPEAPHTLLFHMLVPLIIIRLRWSYDNTVYPWSNEHTIEFGIFWPMSVSLQRWYLAHSKFLSPTPQLLSLWC